MVFGAEGVSEADAPGFLHFLVSHCHLPPHHASLPLSRCWGGAPRVTSIPFGKFQPPRKENFHWTIFTDTSELLYVPVGFWAAGYVVGDDVPVTDLLMRDMGPHRKQEDGSAPSG